MAWLVVLGPGLIAANAGNDAGGIATYASAGAEFGYATLFLMLLVTVALVVVQEMSARLGAHTGEGLMSLIREQFPLRASAFAIVCLLVANLGLVVSEFAGIGAAFEIFGVSRYIAVPIAAVVVWAVVVLGNYRYAERVFLLLSLAFIAYPISAVLAKPSGHEVAVNLLWPHGVWSKEYLFLAVALIGTTITPYMQLYQASAVADRGARGGRIPHGQGRHDHGGDLRQHRVDGDHHRHRRRHRRHRAADLGERGGPGPRAGGRCERRDAVRHRPARRVRARRRGRAPRHVLRGRRGARGRALGLAHVPRGAAVHGPVHGPRRGRRRRWP